MGMSTGLPSGIPMDATTTTGTTTTGTTTTGTTTTGTTTTGTTAISTTAISIRRAPAAALKGMRGLRRLGGAVRQRARRRSSSAETWLRWLMGWPARRVKPGCSGGSPVRRRMPWGLSAIFGRTC